MKVRFQNGQQSSLPHVYGAPQRFRYTSDAVVMNAIQRLCMKGVLVMATLLVSLACKSEDLAKPMAPLVVRSANIVTN